MALSTDPLDLELDSDGDLLIGADGDPVLVAGVAGVTQLIKIALSTWRGEWFANTAFGMPWDQILGQKFDEPLIANAVRDVILSVDDALAINRLDLEYEGSTRTLTITFEAVTTFGDTGTQEVTV